MSKFLYQKKVKHVVSFVHFYQPKNPQISRLFGPWLFVRRRVDACWVQRRKLLQPNRRCRHVNGYRLNKWEAPRSSMLIGNRVTKARPIYKNICKCRSQTPWDITGCPKLVGWKVRNVRMIWTSSMGIFSSTPFSATSANQDAEFHTPYYSESSIRCWRTWGSKWWTLFLQVVVIH